MGYNPNGKELLEFPCRLKVPFTVAVVGPPSVSYQWENGEPNLSESSDIFGSMCVSSTLATSLQLTLECFP